MPLVDGIGEVVEWCRDRDLVPVLATLAWTPVGDYLCGRFGFARCCGPRLTQRDGHFTGSVELHFDEHEKNKYAAEVAASYGLDLQRCAAVGDGPSDMPLFREVGLGIAFNAYRPLRDIASMSLSGRDLRVVLPVLDTWVRGR